MSVAVKGVSMDKKIVSISSKRQITIPLSYFSKLGFGNKAECVLRGNEIVIRPARDVSGGEFAEQILSDLIAQGLSGDELLKQFKLKQAQIRPAVEKLLDEAKKAAVGKSEYSSYEDVFGMEDDT